MPYNFNSNDLARVRARLGPELDVLLCTMLDVDVFPSYLFSDDRARLVQARNAGSGALSEWAAAQPNEVRAVYERLPESLQRVSVVESILSAVVTADYPGVSIGLFEHSLPNSRLLAAAPELIPRLDESGLVTVTNLDARPFGLHMGEFALQYHQLLRRNYTSGIHYGLIAAVLRLADEYDLTARLALDERRLRRRDEYEEIFEHDFWYGRSLTDDDLDVLSAVGETFHGDPQGGTSFLNPYAGLSVRWTADGPLKTVEIEEFMPPPDPDDEWVFARYMHAIRDTSKSAFVHCDGAVKAFAAKTYPTDQKDFRRRGKGDRYRKLFRVDGELPVSVWSELASSWFRGNKLINEYFPASPE